MVSYAILRRADDLGETEGFYKEKYAAAVKTEATFVYDASYLFSIQSEASIREADAAVDEIE